MLTIDHDELMALIPKSAKDRRVEVSMEGDTITVALWWTSRLKSTGRPKRFSHTSKHSATAIKALSLSTPTEAIVLTIEKNRRSRSRATL